MPCNAVSVDIGIDPGAPHEVRRGARVVFRCRSTIFDDQTDRMRTIVLLLASALVIPASAQKGFQFGLKTLPGWAWFLNEDDEGKAGSIWAYGLGANYHFQEGMGVGVDVIWSEEEQEITLNGTEIRNQYSFMKVPILLHFNSDPSETVPFLGYFGVEFTSLKSVDSEADGHTIDDAEELFRDSNVGVVIGLGPGWNINERSSSPPSCGRITRSMIPRTRTRRSMAMIVRGPAWSPSPSIWASR
jgi:hypothetical protein